MFRLDKWYLDCVTDEGTVWIAYVGRVTWGGLGFNFGSTIESPGTGRSTEQTAVRGLVDPAEDGDTIEWRCPGLGVDAHWTATGPRPLEGRLLETPAGAIDWHAALPRATARIRAGSATFEGLGYVERLRLTIPPWRFPFRRLLWGRYLGPRHSAVWIEWTGRSRRHWIWVDGLTDAEARLTPTGLVAGSGLTIDWVSTRDIRNQPVLAMLTERLPAVARRFAGRLDRMHEHKMLSEAALVRGGTVIERGWAVHEVVQL